MNVWDMCGGDERSLFVNFYALYVPTKYPGGNDSHGVAIVSPSATKQTMDGQHKSFRSVAINCPVESVCVYLN